MRAACVAAMSLCMCAPVAVAQVAVPPPPRPADSGPSLEATLQYIQQKLSGVGKVSYVAPWHDMTAGTDGANKFSIEVSNVSVDVAGCRVKFHEKITRDGTVRLDGDYGVPLREAKDVIVEPMEQTTNKANAENGSPNLVASATTPPVVALTVRRQSNGSNSFYFTDPDQADRVAKAFTHAIELCGGGSKELF